MPAFLFSSVCDFCCAAQKEKLSMGNDSQERVSINSFGGRTEKLISPFVGWIKPNLCA